MSTVKIKTEPTTTAAAATAAVDVKVKLEPSLSTADIKLKQHTSDIDTKVESDSEADNEEDYIKSENDDDSDDDQNQFTITPKKQRQLICKHPRCGRSFKYVSNLRTHQHDHRLQVDFNILGRKHILTRQSLDDRWPCPIPNCTSTLKTIDGTCIHIRRYHEDTIKQQQQQQQPLEAQTRNKLNFLDVDTFHVNGVRCGYHTTTGVFICHECRLVPECLLTHLQQKHGYDETSVDNSALPDSAVNASVDPNTNQHTGNPHLAAAIREPNHLQHPDIVQGWLCVTSNCGYCGNTALNKEYHKKKLHEGQQLITIPALVLRLVYGKSRTGCLFINRMDRASGTITISNNGVGWRKLDYSHDGLSAQNVNGGDIDQNETVGALNPKQQWKCEYQNCGQFFNSTHQLYKHRHEHKLDVVINVRGNTFILIRQSLDERWPCPVPDCETTCKTVSCTRMHILKTHSTSIKQKRVNDEDGDDSQHQPIIKRRQRTNHYLNVDDFYVGVNRCGYHNTTGVFICHECQLVPECLLTHLRQEHGLDEKSVDNSILPESAKVSGSDPNINQHTGNSQLALAISHPYRQQYPDIVQGWLCVISDCGQCSFIRGSRDQHHRKEHRGKQQSTVPALVLRLSYAKTQTSGFLITRLDTITDGNIEPINSTSQYKNECDDDDGDELVLSDYGSDDDIH